MAQYGVKLFTTEFQQNLSLCHDRIKFTQDGFFSYIELFSVPKTYETSGTRIIQELNGLPVIIHAAHSKYNFDLGNADLRSLNESLLTEARRFADALQASYIIIHPGFYESQQQIDEMVLQLSSYHDSRFLIENMVLFDEKKQTFYGHTPNQIAYLKEETGCGFCFDFAHAIASANALGLPYSHFLSHYQSLNPTMYHICDGNITKPYDTHDHFGAGNYPLDRFIQMIPDNALVTMETGRSAPRNIQIWLDDLSYIRHLEQKIKPTNLISFC